MNPFNLLRFDYWLDAAVGAQAPGTLHWSLAAAGVLLLLWTTSQLILRRAFSLRPPWLWGVLGGSCLLPIVGKFAGLTVLSWRLGLLLPLAAAMVLLAWPALRNTMRSGALRALVTTLAFQQPGEGTRMTVAGASIWVCAHLLALAVCFANLPALSAAPWLTLAFPVPLLAISLCAGKPSSALPAFAPLIYAYLIAPCAALGISLTGPLNGVLTLPLALIVCSMLGCVLALRTRFADDTAFVRAGARFALAAALLWSVWNSLTLRTHGVTGSDPYAYAQMGIDLAERGTLAHAFPLVEDTYAIGIDSHPVTHMGYRIPADVRRIAPTVWPIGYAWFTALAHRIGGETGVYLLTPLLNLVALAIVFVVTLSFTRHGPDSGWAVAGLCALVTASSLEQVIWQMVPMADIAAQALSFGALGVAWRARGRAFWALLCGVLLGMAFNVRLTQVLIAPALAYALWAGGPASSSAATLRGSIRNIGICAIAACVTALPTFWYHWTWFGSPLATGSEELIHFSLRNTPSTAWRALIEWLSPREFGLLAPCILLGAVALWRSDRRTLLALALYFAPVFALHVVYNYLRLRDMLSLFPVLALLASNGMLALWQLAQQRSVLLRITCVFALSFVFVLRGLETLALPVTRGFSAFGHLLAEERAEFGRLATLTEANAVIGTSLNSGAIDLHAGRLSFRPEAWSDDSLLRFVARMRETGRPVYLLSDGDVMHDAESALRGRYTLREIARLSGPYYLRVSGAERRLLPLYRIQYE
jgi:hypothetical protein